MSEGKLIRDAGDSLQCWGKDGRKEGRMGGRVLQRINLSMQWVYVRRRRQGQRKDREMGSTSLKPPLLQGDFYCLFSTLPPSCLLSFSLLASLFLYSSPCVCVAYTLWCFPSFVSLPFISPPYRFSFLLSHSSFINYLSYEVPYLSFVAPVDLLS